MGNISITKSLIKANCFLIIPILLFAALFLPFINSFPFLDGNIDFVQSINFYEGGLLGYFKLWPSIHPPIKILLTSFVYKLFGLSSVSYNLIGLIFGIVGIVNIYFLTRQLFGQKAAGLATVLLATSPLFLSNAIFASRDFLLTSLVIASFFSYSKKSYKFYALFASLAVLTKETGLVLPIAVAVADAFGLLLFKKKSSCFLFSPFVLYGLWWLLLKSFGQTSWNDYNFSPYASKGGVLTIILNLLNFQFLNKHTVQHWLHLFVLNFSWFYWLVLILFGGFLAFRKGFSQLARLKKIPWETMRTGFAMLMFFLAYLLTALSFPTYAIPRYVLPLVAISLIFLSGIIENHAFGHKPIKGVVYLALFSISFLSLFTSSDPFSKRLWGQAEFYGQTVYDLRNSLAGNDGVTYNLQYAFILHKRTKEIHAISETQERPTNDGCEKLFPDVNYETTVRALGFSPYLLLSSCKKLE